MKRKRVITILAAMAISASVVFAGCGTAGQTGSGSSSAEAAAGSSASSASEKSGDTEASSTGAGEEADAGEAASGQTGQDDESWEVISDDSDGGHAIEADGTEDSYDTVSVVKTGEADGDEADFYGENSAIFATNGATLDLSNITVDTDGTHANAVFSYGEGTTVNISDSEIETSGNCSGGLMTTGGGTMNASNLTIHTTGNSSAAIRSDRGGGTVNVTGGTYTTDGTGSPVIYSTADITVSDAELTSTASQGVVVEGKNSVTLKDITLTADNNTKNSDKSDYYQAVMIYQSMSGDAAEGEASFSMEGGSLTNKNGDIFFVNNTVASIDLTGVSIVNEDEEGIFLRAAAAGWGSEGSNGGHVNLNAQDQQIGGDMAVDEVSTLNLYLKGSSSYTGAINADGAAGEVYVELEEGASWTLTGDSYITSLSCDADAIDLAGHTLYVNGEAYTAGTAVQGEAIEVEVSTQEGGAPEGQPGEAPEGAPGEAMGEAPDAASGESAGESSGNTEEAGKKNRPEKPSGEKKGTPPEKPSGDSKGAASEKTSDN